MKTILKISLPFFSFTLIQSKDENKSSLHFFGDPVPGIDVSLEQIPGGKNVSTTTDDEGEYSFQNLRPGTYKLTFGDKSKRNFFREVDKLDISIKEEGVNRKANAKTPIEPDLSKNYNSSRSNVSHRVTHDPGETVMLTDIG